MVWFFWHIYPWIRTLFEWTIFVNLTVVAPALIQRRYRPTAALIMYISSYLFGLECWLLSLGVCHDIGGWVLVLIGFFLAGVGLVPLAILAALFTAHWQFFWVTPAIFLLAMGSRAASWYIGGFGKGGECLSPLPTPAMHLADDRSDDGW